MAFNISYIYQAIDKFTPVANKIKRSVDGIKNKLADTRKSLNKFGSDLRGIGGKLTAFASTSIGFLGFNMIKAASDAEESASKFDTVFSSISGAANGTAKELSRSFGLSRTESKKLLGDTGDLLTGFGFSQKAALDMSTQVNKLAVDLASFTNIEGGASRASAALTKALLGERESVKSLGISILEEDVKARVKQLVQVDKMKFASLRQAKAFATLQLATEQSKNAVGDFARTQESSANLTRIAAAATQDLKETFGKLLLPIYNKIILAVTTFIRKLEDTNPMLKKIILAVAALVFVMGPLLVMIGLAASGFALMLSPIALVVGGVMALIAAIGFLAVKYKPVRDMLRLGFESIKFVVLTLIETFSRLGKKISDILPDFGLFEKISSKINGFFGGEGGGIGKLADKIASINESLTSPDIGRGGVAAQEVRTQTRLDGNININAPAGVVKSADARVSGSGLGNLGMNMVGAGL